MKLTYIPTTLNKYTFKSKKIKAWVENRTRGNVLNLFAGKIKLSVNEYRVDIDKKMVADIYKDAYTYIKQTPKKFDTVLLDPPYSYRKAMEFYKGKYTSKFRQIADELVKIAPRIISFGYHNTFMGEIRGYKLEEICIFGHGGAQHATIAIVETRRK